MSEENNQENQQDTSWSENFPEDVRNWDECKNSQNSEQFWQRITSHRKHLGQSIRIPTDEAGADDMNAFYDKLQKRVPNLMPVPDTSDDDAMKAVLTKLGMPEDVNGYADVVGDELQFSDGQLDSIRGLALNAGLTKTQFKKLAEQIGVKTAQEMGAMSENKESQKGELKEAWGMASEDRLSETNAFLKQSGAPENLVDAMSNSDLDAQTVMWLHSLAAGIGENNEISNQAGGGNSDAAITPYEAQERINEMLSNREHPYHRGDKRAKTRMHELMTAAKAG